MDYGADRPDSLNFDPFKAIVAPRPIGWIGTEDDRGVANLAPYSFFAPQGTRPNMVSFTSQDAKHSVANARERGAFTVSLATEALADKMNLTAGEFDASVDEFAQAGLAVARGGGTGMPFVAESPAVLDCATVSVTALNDLQGMPTGWFLVIGQVVWTHIRDEYLQNGRFDTVAARPIARMGYRDYSTVRDSWELLRPDD